ncbi:MAG: hypothetical protein WBD74_15170 [Candidatus Aquilonibacter sp.]
MQHLRKQVAERKRIVAGGRNRPELRIGIFEAPVLGEKVRSGIQLQDETLPVGLLEGK